METFEARMNRYIKEYSERVWPNLPVPEIEDHWAVDLLEIRADGYASAHVDGEHEAWEGCPYRSAQECGERMAAEEFVETR